MGLNYNNFAFRIRTPALALCVSVLPLFCFQGPGMRVRGRQIQALAFSELRLWIGFVKDRPHLSSPLHACVCGNGALGQGGWLIWEGVQCFTHKRSLLMVLLELSRDGEFLEAFYFKRYLTILYINNFSLPHSPGIPLLLHDTRCACLQVEGSRGAEHSQLISNVSHSSIYSDIGGSY